MPTQLSNLVQTPRNIFVSMLFALVLGNSSILLNEIFFGRTENWLDALLIWGLGFIVIITSWVDWSNSFSESGNSSPTIEKIISPEFGRLLLDIIILYLYSALFANIPINKELNFDLVANSALTILLIFFFYTVWDEINYRQAKKLDFMWALAPGSVCCLLSSVILLVCNANQLTPTILSVLLYVVVVIFRTFHSIRKKKFLSEK